MVNGRRERRRTRIHHASCLTSSGSTPTGTFLYSSSLSLFLPYRTTGNLGPEADLALVRGRDEVQDVADQQALFYRLRDTNRVLGRSRTRLTNTAHVPRAPSLLAERVRLAHLLLRTRMGTDSRPLGKTQRRMGTRSLLRTALRRSRRRRDCCLRTRLP